jgi:penicillin-binding protein 1A
LVKLTPRRRNILIVVIALLLVFGYVAWDISRGLPSLEQLEQPHPEIATRIVSTDGEPIDQFYIKNRTTVHLRNIPPFMLKALIATEDRNFYKHWGVDVTGILRAFTTDIFTLQKRQGASTITQQLARNLYLNQEKTAIRKLREAVTAVQIERTHTKEEILEMYFNVTYFGRGAYGVQAASQAYFGKDVNKLTPAQAAYLIGILKGPENYDPDDDYDRAVNRRNTVIENMVNAGAITEAESAKVKKQPLKTKEYTGYQGIAPHFAEMVRQQLSKMPEMQGYDLYRDGLTIYTTMNAAMQRAANRAVAEHVEEYQKTVVDKRFNWKTHQALLDSSVAKAIRQLPEYREAPSDADRLAIAVRLKADKTFIDSVKTEETRMQAGFVCIDQATGQILAMVGASNYKQVRYGLNHVTQIIRQPGSSFKPIVYASAFEHGASPESMVSNEPISVKMGGQVWRPHNFEGEAEGGFTTVRYAIEQSLNLAAVHTIEELTSVSDVVKLAHKLGIQSNVPPYPSIALGTADVSPLELTSAYSTFANDGTRATPYAIVRVEDRSGKIIYQRKPEYDNVLEPRVAREVTSALQDVVDNGTGKRVRNYFHYPAAGKTGTTQNYADAWFVGYTPHYTAGVWVGFDDKRMTFSGADGQGGRAAAPIWGRFMKYAYDAVKPPIEYFNTAGIGTTNGSTPSATDSNAAIIDSSRRMLSIRRVDSANVRQPTTDEY